MCKGGEKEMKRWKALSAVLVSGALIATNIYLITKEDSKASRSIFVEDWTKVKQATVIETFQTKGVTTSAEEYKVYFDGADKDFQRFLVKEGDEIKAGTPLYEYKLKDIDQQVGNLKQEIAELDGEITGIGDYIQKLTDYKKKVPSASKVSDVLQNSNLDPNASADLISSALEQEIYKQELEKRKLEEGKKKLDSQLKTLNEQSGPLTIDSKVDGVVKKVDDTLGNPVMTVVSAQQAIGGVLSESELRKTKVGMRVKINSPLLDKTMNGTIGHVGQYPTKEPSLEQSSVFPFQVMMEAAEEQATPLVIGSKVEVTVITNESIDVPTVPSKIVHSQSKPYLFRLTEKGYVNKEYITSGLKADKKLEIVKGPVKGDVVLVSPRKIPKNHSTFITPIQTKKIAFSACKNFTTREKLRYFLIGMVEK